WDATYPQKVREPLLAGESFVLFTAFTDKTLGADLDENRVPHKARVEKRLTLLPLGRSQGDALTTYLCAGRLRGPKKVFTLPYTWVSVRTSRASSRCCSRWPSTPALPLYLSISGR